MLVSHLTPVGSRVRRDKGWRGKCLAHPALRGAFAERPVSAWACVDAETSNNLLHASGLHGGPV
jgi:hypothetical protein